MTARPPPSATETTQRRLAVMAAELARLKTRRFDRDDLADRGLARSLIEDVRTGLADLEAKLGLRPVELEDDRRLRRLRRG